MQQRKNKKKTPKQDKNEEYNQIFKEDYDKLKYFRKKQKI